MSKKQFASSAVKILHLANFSPNKSITKRMPSRRRDVVSAVKQKVVLRPEIEPTKLNDDIDIEPMTQSYTSIPA